MITLFDTETTGTIPGKSRVCQLAAATFRHGKGCNPLLSTLVKPAAHIPQECIDVHHITNEDVQYSVSEQRTLGTFRMLLKVVSPGSPSILAGHNVKRFDIPLIQAIYPAGDFDKHPAIDTLQLAIRRDPGGRHKLGEIYEDLTGKPPTGAHDAMVDILMCGEILQIFMDEMQMGEEELVAYGNDPMVLTHWPWGKHKGTPMEKVPKTYLEWAKSKFKDVSEDIIITIDTYLYT